MKSTRMVSTNEIVSALEEANDSDVRYFKPTDEEQSYFHRIYARLISEVQDQHDKTVAPTIAYNKKKIENWVDVQQEQLHVQLTDAQKEVEEYILAEMQATDTLEKKDIRKKAAEAKKKMDKLQHDLPKRRKEARKTLSTNSCLHVHSVGNRLQRKISI